MKLDTAGQVFDAVSGGERCHFVVVAFRPDGKVFARRFDARRVYTAERVLSPESASAYSGPPLAAKLALETLALTGTAEYGRLAALTLAEAKVSA